MLIFNNPFSLHFPVRIGHITTSFFINENLYVTSTDCVSQPHNHHDFEIRYISSGICNQIICGQSYSASVGDVLIVHPFEYHCQTPDSVNHASSQYNLRFSIVPPAEGSSPEAQRAFKELTDVFSEMRRCHDKSGVLLTYMKLLTDEIYNKSTGFITNMQSLCLMILTEIVRLSGKKTKDLFPSEEIKYNGNDRVKIESFMITNILNDVKIEDLAAEANISSRQVNRIMHKMYGMSFTQKLTELRLQLVLIQLTHSDKPIAQVSRDCGFKNYNYFSICFRKAYGLTPTEYRKNSR